MAARSKSCVPPVLTVKPKTRCAQSVNATKQSQLYFSVPSWIYMPNLSSQESLTFCTIKGFFDERISHLITLFGKRIEFDWDFVDGFAYRIKPIKGSYGKWYYSKNDVFVLRSCQLCLAIGTTKKIKRQSVWKSYTDRFGKEYWERDSRYLCTVCRNKLKPLDKRLNDFFSCDYLIKQLSKEISNARKNQNNR